MGRRQLKSVHPQDPGMRPSWGHLGPGLGLLGRRPHCALVGRHDVAVTSAEEEEEVSLEEDRREHLDWNTEAAMGQSFDWAHLTSPPGIAAPDAATAAAASCCASDGSLEQVGVSSRQGDSQEEEEKEESHSNPPHHVPLL